MEPEFDNHLKSEGIEYVEKTVPEQLNPLIGNSDKELRNADFLDFDEEEVILYRGDHRNNLEEIRQEDGSLERDFPIYFTDSKRDAIERYAGDIDQEGYLVEVSVPFESIDYLGKQKAKEIERGDIPELEPGKMYYMKSFLGTIELGATRVPADWINSIELLDQN